MDALAIQERVSEDDITHTDYSDSLAESIFSSRDDICSSSEEIDEDDQEGQRKQKKRRFNVRKYE